MSFKQQPKAPFWLQAMGAIGGIGVVCCVAALVINLIAMALGFKPPFGF